MRKITISFTDEVFDRFAGETRAYLMVRGGQPGNVMEAVAMKLVEVLDQGKTEYLFRFVKDDDDQTNDDERTGSKDAGT